MMSFLRDVGYYYCTLTMNEQTETHTKRRAIAVFCSSSESIDEVYFDAARELGEAIGKSRHTVIYGGGNLGLMGCVADAAHRAGGRVHGVITEKLRDLEQARHQCDELEIVRTMRERKARMEALADAFIILPGGIGTLEEFFEIVVGRFLGEHDKAIVLVNVAGYFDPLLTLLDHAASERFMDRGFLRLFDVVEKPAQAIGLLRDVFDPRANNHIYSISNDFPVEVDGRPVPGNSSIGVDSRDD
jgi:hypothetical protein